MTEREQNSPPPGRTVLVYSCSGAANVAEVADRACRLLSEQGDGSMFCLAGLGADVPEMVRTAAEADLNLVIDGCPVDCGKRVFERHGLKNYRQIRVTDLGIDRRKGGRCDDQQVAVTVGKAREVLRREDSSR